MRLVQIIACALSAIVVAAPAMAQDTAPQRGQRARMPQLTPEKTKAAWEWQARGLADELKLTNETTRQVTEIYLAARRKYADAIGAEPGQGRERGARDGNVRGQGPLGFGPNRAALLEARVALKADLVRMLNGEQTEQAMASLGSFSRQWDVTVDAILGFRLEPEKTHAALVPVRAYIVELGALRDAGEWEAMREGMRDARAKLKKELRELLTEEQMATLEQLAGRRGRGGQRQRGGREGDGDRDPPDRRW